MAAAFDAIDLNQKINGHSITVGWLLESLRGNDKTFQKFHGNRSVKEVTFKNIGEGEGFVSEIIRCILTFTDSKNSSDIYTTLLKIPNLDGLIEANVHKGDENVKNYMIESYSDIHKFECEFYTHLAPILDAPIPKVFKSLDSLYGKQEGCIHMEDLSKKGKCLLFFENIYLTQVKVFIQQLAHMHKNILSADPKIWRGKYLKNQEFLLPVIDLVTPMIEPFLKKSKREKELRPIFEKYGKIITSKDYIRYAMAESYKDQDLAPVIVHGDMHSGNIMWVIDENGDIQNEIAAIIDWQMIHEGSPMSDLARFLTYSADGVVRRQAEEFAIDYYMECLTKEFDGDSTKVPYTKDQLKKSYNYMFIVQVSMLHTGATFMFDGLNEPNKALKDAYFDVAVLKALNAYEDAVRLLDGDMNDIFEKYGG